MVEKALLISLVSKVEGVLSTEVSSFDKEANILDADISQENKIISDYRAAAHCGPQQLYKHKLLAGIYFALLSNPDPLIAQLALPSKI